MDLVALVQGLELTPKEIEERDDTEADRYWVYRSPRVEELRRTIAALGASAVPAFQEALAARRSPEALLTAAQLIGREAVAAVPAWFEAAFAGTITGWTLTSAVRSLAPFGSSWPQGRPHAPLFLRAIDHQDEDVAFAGLDALNAVGPAPEDLPVLLRALDRAPLTGEAARALGRLGEAGRSAVPALLTKWEAKPGGPEALDALGRIGGTGVAEALGRALDSPLGELRMAAASALAERKMTAQEPLLVALLAREADIGVRHRVALAIATLRGLPRDAADRINREHPATQAASGILDRLRSPNVEARLQALRQIEHLPSPPVEAIPFILPFLKDRGYGGQAAIALGAFGAAGAPAIPALCEALQSEIPEFVHRAALALGAIGSLDAVDALMRLLGSKKSPMERGSAGRAVLQIGTVEHLIGKLEGGGETARAAAERLGDVAEGVKRGELEVPPAIEDALLPRLSDPDATLVVAAARALSRGRSGKKAAAELARLLPTSPAVALEALAAMGYEAAPARAAVKPYAASADGQIRPLAERALKAMGEPWSGAP